MNILAIGFVGIMVSTLVLLTGKGIKKQLIVVAGGFGVLALGLIQCRMVNCNLESSLLLVGNVSPGIAGGYALIIAGLLRLVIDAFR